MKQYSSGVLFESSSEPSTVGSLIMAWPDCINGMFSYDLTTAGLGTGAYELAQITRVKGSSCQ